MVVTGNNFYKSQGTVLRCCFDALCMLFDVSCLLATASQEGLTLAFLLSYLTFFVVESKQFSSQ